MWTPSAERADTRKLSWQDSLSSSDVLNRSGEFGGLGRTRLEALYGETVDPCEYVPAHSPKSSGKSGRIVYPQWRFPL